jgi:hypothetical protein
LVAGLLAACDDMQNQPKFKPLEPSAFFADGRSARTPVPGTVPRGHLRTDRLFFEGREKDALAHRFPMRVTRPMIVRGQERFNIHCAVCHSRTGDGRGMIVQRGFPPPPTFHSDRLRQAPAGHFFDVITNGFGTMYSYADRVPAGDRWAIIAYVRALQLSQNARFTDVPADERTALERMR